MTQASDFDRRQRRLQLAPPDAASEQLRRAQRLAAVLAIDRKRRADRGRTRGAAPKHRPAALGAFLRNLILELLEPSTRGAAVEAERNPVSEHLAALLPQPVGSPSHATSD